MLQSTRPPKNLVNSSQQKLGKSRSLDEFALVLGFMGTSPVENVALAAELAFSLFLRS